MPTQGEPRGRALLPPVAPEVAAAVLAPPWLPAAAASRATLARRAGASAVPVVLAAPPGAGRQLIARALHSLAARHGPLVAATGRRPRLDGLPEGSSLYLDLARLAPESLIGLEALLDDGAVWLIAGTAPDASVPPPLAPRVGALVLDVPPLASRKDDLPALARSILDRLAGRAGTQPLRLSDAALERLAGHSWPGDVVELEAVLGRAALLAEGAVEAEHVVLVEERTLAPAAVPAPTAGMGAELEFLLAELAHELRNPMVTIKTYARHLPALLEDADLRARFETLTNDAIDRMDGLLENVLTFARLGPPRPEPVEVAPLLARVLVEVEPELGDRVLHLRHAGEPGARCAADPQHLAYALRNLLAGVVREVPAREQLALETSANGVVTLRFAAGAEAADRLRRLAAPTDSPSLSDPTLLPLAFRLARAVLERNGGALTVVPEAGDATSVVVRLPTALEEAS